MTKTKLAAAAAAPGRKGASRRADISPTLLAALSRGEVASATLSEGLAVDQVLLLQTVFPDLPAAVYAQAQAAAQLGILKRTMAMADLLWEARGQAALTHCRSHVSDTVRGWACFMTARAPAADVAARLAAIAPLADDTHFGVREWAWMAVRPELAAALPQAIAALQAWTTASSPYLRRFAIEALRPRGVWCAHIAALRQQPEQMLPLLQALRADPEKYVQDSVANWLNDAAKDQPDWVRQVCAQWREVSPGPATARICQRALRSLKT